MAHAAPTRTRGIMRRPAVATSLVATDACRKFGACHRYLTSRAFRRISRSRSASSSSSRFEGGRSASGGYRTYCRLVTMYSTMRSFQKREAETIGVMTKSKNFVFSSMNVWKSVRPDPFHIAHLGTRKFLGKSFVSLHFMHWVGCLVDGNGRPRRRHKLMRALSPLLVLLACGEGATALGVGDKCLPEGERCGDQSCCMGLLCKYNPSQGDHICWPQTVEVKAAELPAKTPPGESKDPPKCTPEGDPCDPNNYDCCNSDYCTWNPNRGNHICWPHFVEEKKPAELPAKTPRGESKDPKCTPEGEPCDPDGYDCCGGENCTWNPPRGNHICWPHLVEEKKPAELPAKTDESDQKCLTEGERCDGGGHLHPCCLTLLCTYNPPRADHICWPQSAKEALA